MLRVTPVNVQVRHRITFAPPNYSIVTTEVAASLATRFAEVFNLKSTGIIFNQNSMSGQYLSFRYVLPNSPVRYIDALIGVDQAEVLFLNPLNVSELKEEFLKVWKAMLEKSKPKIAEHYFEATLHCTTEGVGAENFLDKLVSIQTMDREIHKGFSLTSKHSEISGEARIGLEVSTSLPDGLYLIFVCASKKKVENLAGLGDLIDKTIDIYRNLQPLAQIEVLEVTP